MVQRIILSCIRTRNLSQPSILRGKKKCLNGAHLRTAQHCRFWDSSSVNNVSFVPLARSTSFKRQHPGVHGSLTCKHYQILHPLCVFPLLEQQTEKTKKAIILERLHSIPPHFGSFGLHGILVGRPRTDSTSLLVSRGLKHDDDTGTSHGNMGSQLGCSYWFSRITSHSLRVSLR